MDSLLTLDPSIINICGRLSFQELKSLSLVSDGWREVTDSFVISRAILNINKPCGIEFYRRYKRVKVCEVDLKDVISCIPDSIEVLELKDSGINFMQLKKFKNLKSLTVDHASLPKQTPIPTDLVLGLQSLNIKVNGDSLELFQELIPP